MQIKNAREATGGMDDWLRILNLSFIEGLLQLQSFYQTKGITLYFTFCLYSL